MFPMAPRHVEGLCMRTASRPLTETGCCCIQTVNEALAAAEVTACMWLACKCACKHLPTCLAAACVH